MMWLAKSATLVVFLLLASIGTACAEGSLTGQDLLAIVLAFALWAWEMLKSTTLTQWLLLGIAFGLSGIASAIASGFRSLIEMLTEKLEPVSEHYRAIEERRSERQMIGDLLREGVATREDIDRLSELDAEERPRSFPDTGDPRGPKGK
jgi:hypothetical protein